jgi:hypothetical protein
VTIAAVATVLALVMGASLATSAPASGQTPERRVAIGVVMRRPFQGTYDEFIASVGRPAIWMLWPTWRGKPRFPDPALLSYLLRKGTVPMLTWQPYDPTHQRKITWRAIRDGEYDRYIAQFANIVRRARGRVIIRFAHEMNGDWFSWGLCHATSTGRRQFRQAWRRVVGIFRRVGATNARFLWSPNGQPRRCSGSLASLYPGDRFVDLVGISAYNWGKLSNAYERRVRPWSRWQSAVEVLTPGLGALTRIAPSKPVYIAELGSSPDAPSWTSKAEWIRDGYPAIYRRFPQVRAVIYFNVDMSRRSDPHENWSLTSPDRGPLREYRVIVRDPRFQGVVD